MIWIKMQKGPRRYHYRRWELAADPSAVHAAYTLDELAETIARKYIGKSGKNDIARVRRAIIKARNGSCEWFQVPELEPEIVCWKLARLGMVGTTKNQSVDFRVTTLNGDINSP